MSELPARFGVYELLKLLGRGSFGEVYLARPVEGRRGVPTPVVIKRLHADLVSEDRFVSRFSHEAELATSIDSPFVAKVYDAGVVDRQLYIAFEYIPGWPLADVIEDLIAGGNHTTLESIADIADDVLRGLAAIHAAKDPRGEDLGIVHRDLSPKNIMLGDDGRVRLIDLGIGKSRIQGYKTRTGAVLGTPGYMPPEQVLAQPQDHRADLYSAGIVLWELTTLERYVAPASLVDMLRSAVQSPYRSAIPLRRDVPEELDRVFRRAISASPDERFQSAEELRLAVRRVIPERRDRQNMATLLGQMMWSERSQAETDLRTRLSVAPSESEAETPRSKTVVFAMRAGVELTADAELNPTFVPDPTKLLPAPQAARAPRLASKLGRYVATGAAAVALVVAGMMIERRRRDEVLPAPLVATPLRETPAAVSPVRAESIPKATERERERERERDRERDREGDREGDDKRGREGGGDAVHEAAAARARVEASRTKRPAQKNTPANTESTDLARAEDSRETARAPAASAAEPEPSGELVVDALLTRTRKLRDRTPESAPARAQIDRVLAELLRLRGTPSIDARDPRVTTLATELSALERNARGAAL